MHCNAKPQLTQAIWLLIYGICCLLYGICCLLYSICCLLHGICCLLYGLCHTVCAGGQGFADVAVTCLARAAGDTPHSKQKEEAQGPPLSPNLTWQELQGHISSAGSSPEKARAGLLGAAFGAAANVFKAIGNPGKSGKGRLHLIQIDMHHIVYLSYTFLDMHFKTSPGSLDSVYVRCIFSKQNSNLTTTSTVVGAISSGWIWLTLLCTLSLPAVHALDLFNKRISS